MGSWHKALFIAGIAFFATSASASAHMGGMGGRSSGGGFHGGFQGFHSGRTFSGLHGFPFRNPRLRFARQQFDGWNGGAYSGDVAAYGYDGDDDFAPEDLHFRVQESFGPGDIGRPTPPPPQAYDNGPRMDPWHGYGSDDW